MPTAGHIFRTMTHKRLRRISTLGSRITSLVSVALVLILLGLAVFLGLSGKNLTDDVRRNLGFVIKMERDCPDSQTNMLKRALLASPAVSRMTFSSADDIMAEESQYLGEDIRGLLDSNPYSAEFDVRVRPEYASVDSIEALVERFGSVEGVHEVVTESAVIEGVDSMLKRVGAVLLIVAAILLAVSVALINNTIRLSIYARRFVIHTMKLVGATGGFIRRPFVISGMVSGMIAGLCASAFLCAVRLYIERLDPTLARTLPWEWVALVCVALTLLGMSICVITAAVATNRYIRASYDEMFLK